MKVDCRTDAENAGVLTATLSGKLDALGADETWQALSPQLDERRCHLIVDMSGVNLLTSAGVGTLIRIRHRLQRFGGGLALFSCPPRVLEVIRIVLLEDVLLVSENAAQARARLGVDVTA